MPSEFLAVLNVQTLVFVAGASLLLALLGVLLALVALIRLGALRRRYLSLVKGESGADLENLIVRNHRDTEAVLAGIGEIRDALAQHDRRIREKTRTAVITRYNAFGELGNDLSFSLSLLDETGNGAVISSIYGREESRVYAKPVTSGDSSYTLTDEERHVIAGGRESK